MDDPLAKVYITSRPLVMLPLVLALFTISQIKKLRYDGDLATLRRIEQTDEVDGYVLVVGLATILKQWHPSYLRMYLEAISQFVRSNVHCAFAGENVHESGSEGGVALPKDAQCMMTLMEQICSITGLETVDYVPSLIGIKTK